MLGAPSTQEAVQVHITSSNGTGGVDAVDGVDEFDECDIDQSV
jgi:hypothetical protein